MVGARKLIIMSKVPKRSLTAGLSTFVIYVGSILNLQVIMEKLKGVGSMSKLATRYARKVVHNVLRVLWIYSVGLKGG